MSTFRKKDMPCVFVISRVRGNAKPPLPHLWSRQNNEVTARKYKRNFLNVHCSNLGKLQLEVRLINCSPNPETYKVFPISFYIVELLCPLALGIKKIGPEAIDIHKRYEISPKTIMRAGPLDQDRPCASRARLQLASI